MSAVPCGARASDNAIVELIPETNLNMPMDKNTSWMSDRFEFSRHVGGRHVLPMEGLCGFAVILVFLVHYVSLSSPWVTSGTDLAEFPHGIHQVGNTGIELFLF